jgi:hypothetical protein
MRVSGGQKKLEDGATVAILGGGPAGAFSAIHLKRQARKRGQEVRVVLFEQNCRPGDSQADRLWGPYSGCPKCAGGLSPPLCDALQNLDISLPQEVVQSHIASVTVQGNWKSIVLPTPRDRRILSVYRGTLPHGQQRLACFDALLQSVAMDHGTELIGGRIFRVEYNAGGGIDLAYSDNGSEHSMAVDFLIFAGGVNEKKAKARTRPDAVELLQSLQPEYAPPRLRKALIFELEAPDGTNGLEGGDLHYVESSHGRLKLDMCSILSKRGYITVTLIGQSVDAATSHQQNLQVIRDFLATPRIRRTLPPQLEPEVCCICNPRLVVGTATTPFGDRIAAVGDMATCRLYKDGILSSHNMAESLAATLFERGVDRQSLERGYGPTLADFRRDNRFAAIIFFLYRWFFTSPSWSRIVYQAYASEKKSKPEQERRFKRVIWAISSGDGRYEDIAWSMLRPGLLWAVVSGGVLVTLRNRLAEIFFGLDWHGIDRVPTVVSVRELAARRSGLLPGRYVRFPGAPVPEFECIYTVRIRAPVERVWELLAKLGEEDRPYLNPRWVQIRRSRGEPLRPGSVIHYTVFGGLISFSIKQRPPSSECPHVLAYRVRDGFAHGGDFLFEVLPLPAGDCELTVYLAFDYARGRSVGSRVYYYLVRKLFPEFIHDVLWNHALCELRECAERNAARGDWHLRSAGVEEVRITGYPQSPPPGTAR